MMRYLRRIGVGTTVWLFLVWVILFASLDPLTLLSGIVIACLIQMLFPLPKTNVRWRIRPLKLLTLLAVFTVDLVKSTWQVSVLVLTGRRVNNEIVQVPMKSSDSVHMTIMSALTSLVPGSLVVRVDRKAGVLDLHVFDIKSSGGRKAVIERTQKLEARLLDAIDGTPILPIPSIRIRKGVTS